MSRLLKEYIELILSESKEASDAIVSASAGNLRSSGSKGGALRLAPVEAGAAIDEKTLMLYFKKAGAKNINVVPPKSPGSASSKFNTYTMNIMGRPVNVVIGQGRNLGQSFEDDVNVEANQAIAGGKLTPRINQLFKDIGVKPTQVASIEQASKKRVKRPLTPDLVDVGSVISDMTLVLKNKKFVYISIKNVSGDTFANAGCSGMFEVQESKKGTTVLPSPHPLDDFVKALGIDKNAAAKGYTNYANKVKEIPVGRGKPNLNKVRDYLVGAFGYGYWYAREEGSGFHVIDMTTPQAVKEHVGEVTDIQIRYPGVSKQITCIINTSNGRYVVEIRNSHGGIDPNEIKIKVA